MVSSQYKTIGYIFDIIAGIVSLLDLTTDIIIMITWYSQDRMTFFWISCVILILAQISYVVIFYLNHGKHPESEIDLCHSILSCICTLPFTPFLSFIFYMVSDDDSYFRKFIDKLACYNLDWHTLYIDPNSNPTKQYLDEKLYKHLGFLMEAVIEAFPQSILQLTALVYYNEANVISIISILISMSSVCGKLLLLVSTDFRGWKLKIFVWLCFVIDFFSVFFIVSYTFYTPTKHPEYQSYFIFIRYLCFYEFLFCVVPFAVIGSIGIHIYWDIRATMSSPKACCLAFIGISFLWILGLSITLIMMQILCMWWYGLMIIWQATGERLPWNNGAGKQFFSDQIKWILNSCNDKEKITKICVFNEIMMEQHPNIRDKTDNNKWKNIYNEKFHKYLKNESKTQFKNVSLNELRQNAINLNHNYRVRNGDRLNERDPRIVTAFYYEFYSGPLWEFEQEKMNGGNRIFDIVAVCTCWILTYIFLPIYLISRLWNLIMPLFIVIYLYMNGGIILFIDIEIFQVIMWIIYVSLLFIWFILLYVVCKEEYILWHMLPNIERFVGSDDYTDTFEVDRLIKDRYFQITLYPIIEQIIMDKFGQDIACVILEYFKTMRIPFCWTLLVQIFGEEVSAVILDYMLEIDLSHDPTNTIL